MIKVIHDDCISALAKMPENSIDSCVTDPPYHLTSIVKRFGAENAAPAKGNAAFIRASKGFMGKTWDGGDVALRLETWAEVYRVLKPGGHLLAMGGTRTYHRLVCAIEDAGFEIRDTIGWLYGTGFPKSHDVAMSIDKAARGVPHGGVDPTSANHGKYKTQATEGKRTDADNGQGFGAGPGQFMKEVGTKEKRVVVEEAEPWTGWGTALKPAMELICVARKPLSERTIAANVLRHGAGGLNIDACRVETADGLGGGAEKASTDARDKVEGWDRPWMHDDAAVEAHASRVRVNVAKAESLGRWPANVCHDGSDEVVAKFPSSKSTGGQASLGAFRDGKIYGSGRNEVESRDPGIGDEGSNARFFYAAKASKADRFESKHPTVKPVNLMRWLVKMVTPQKGTVLDPFAGSGTTAAAAKLEGFNAILIEKEEEYVTDIRRRVAALR